MSENVVQRQQRIRVEPLDSAEWRLILPTTHDGATNMAIDEAIGDAVRDGAALPTLRFYGWQPACLSLGRAQSWDVADFERCADLGWDVVRRPTGGRAVLHIDELTYSVVAPESEPRVKGGVLESYRRLSAALYNGLHQLGIQPERALPYYADRGATGPACFDGPSDYEVTIAQRKLIGSAQQRRNGIVLQHGSLPLTGDVTRVRLGLRLDGDGQRAALQNRLRWRATTLAEALAGRELSLDESADYLRRGFEETLNITFVESELSSAERERATQIRKEKYANDTWTKRR
jgi:lipoate-protein ligase A